MLSSPLFLINVIGQAWPFIVALVYRAQCAYYLRQYARHPLVQLAQTLDFAPLEQGCAAFHRGTGRGATVTHPVPRLVRALLLKYLYDYSYRHTEEMIDLHLLARWFVGCAPFETPPDHSTLCRFELWVLAHQPHLFSREVLRQIDRLCPDDRNSLHVVDSFAMLARGARCALLTLMQDLNQHTLTALHQVAPDRHAAVLAAIEPLALGQQAGQKLNRALNAAERAERLQNLVTATLALHRLVTDALDQSPCLPPEQQAPVRRWLAYLHKVLADETTLTVSPAPPPTAEASTQASPTPPPTRTQARLDESLTTPPETVTAVSPVETATSAAAPQASTVTSPAETPPVTATSPAPAASAASGAAGREVSPGEALPVLATDPTLRLIVTERPHGHKGSYRLGCANDPEASYRHHGADKGDGAKLGFNVSLLTSRRGFVRAIQADTGARPDEEALPDLLRYQFQQHGFYPKKLAGDQAYGTGKTRAIVAALTGGQTHLIALVPDYEKRSDRFSPSAFTLSDDGLRLTCPHDVTTTKIYRKPGADGNEFVYTHHHCQGCPFWVTPDQLAQNPHLPHCREPQAKPHSRRKVFISDYRCETLAALAYNKTETFKTEIKHRAGIERIIFNLTHFFGARHAQSTGLARATFQARMAATAFNLRHLLRYLAWRPGADPPGPAPVA